MDSPIESPHGASPIISAGCSLISILSACLAWISLQDVQIIAAIVASLIAAISGGFGIVYFWFSIKEKKLSIKNLNKNP